ncbi:2OG-Fe(II) oxygenase [Glaciimonas immobilis]|uniref:SM-20-related protein n=1 Tax=Glaciimonas immobilis TaxID=728004 RepID=A0A840RZ09_9BURK|nr:2OG-Fe(II) oxygenase [Glaciimonas immobilis]KAF3996001.1 2OG-Fe(II) oxygenase [Glaciimonas immobilis]MBB5202472.1 SM-20-related protein [Glaciimonas immobilis]
MTDAAVATLTDDLVARGWSYTPDFLPADLIAALSAECYARAERGALAPAAVGRGAGQAVRENIRGDQIQWLEGGQSPFTDVYLKTMGKLRHALNQALYLGLEEFETHFALYPPGTFYQQHVDRFNDDDRRVVSSVLYLNQDWLPQHGGALRLHLKGQPPQDVYPLAGSLVIFLSSDMLHEVLPATRPRLSLTGWFKRR